MKTTHIKQFCEDNSQSDAAEILGCTQGNISQIVSSGREIYIVQKDGRPDSYYEIAKLKKHKNPTAA